MTGSALFDFLIACVVLIAVVAMFFYAMDKIAPDATFAKIAKIAVGVVALIAFLLAVKAVFFGGGGAVTLGGMQLIEFAVGLIVILLVVYLAYMVVDFLGFYPAQIKYVIGAVALIVLLLLAGKALFGGGLGFLPMRADLVLMLA